jgi:hypothetical protein
MQFKRPILPKILLVIGFLALFLIIKYQNSIKDLWLFNLEKLKIHLDNFLNPQIERRRPITLLDREDELRLYIGEPFRNFTPEDWDWFWDIVYGVFPEGEPQKKGLPKGMRQLNFNEISSKLMSRYPQPFTYFKKEHWNIFFGIIFKK